jgi:hypothetical protein
MAGLLFVLAFFEVGVFCWPYGDFNQICTDENDPGDLPDRRKTVKLKLIFVCLAIALVQTTPLNAQAVSSAGHYSKKSGGPGEMRVERSEGGWRIFAIAAGVPRPRGLTAADCGLIAVGAIEGDTFQGEIKYVFDNTADRKAVLDYLKGGNSKPSDIDVEPGQKLTITFARQSATLPDGQFSVVAAGCPDHTGLFGRYTKDRKR